MAFRQVMSGCFMVCGIAASVVAVCTPASAEPFPGAQQYATLDAPAFGTVRPAFDPTLLVVAGASHGGLVTMAYGAHDAHSDTGVRGLINFSGGLRQDECSNWQKNLTSAFGEYGEHVKLPSLWMYGSNDSVWQGTLPDDMF